MAYGGRGKFGRALGSAPDTGALVDCQESPDLPRTAHLTSHTPALTYAS